MNGKTYEQLKFLDVVYARLRAEGLPADMPLKLKYRVGRMPGARPHTCNHGGGFGRMKGRAPGWKKHGKGPANVSR